ARGDRRHPDRPRGARLGADRRAGPGPQRAWPWHAVVPGRAGDRYRAAARAAGAAGGVGVRRLGRARAALRLRVPAGRPGQAAAAAGDHPHVDVDGAPAAAAEGRGRGINRFWPAGHDRGSPGRDRADHTAVAVLLGDVRDAGGAGHLARDLHRPARAVRDRPRLGAPAGARGAAAQPPVRQQRPVARARLAHPCPRVRGAGLPVRFRVDPRRVRRRAAGADRGSRPGLTAPAVPGQAGGNRLRLPGPHLLHLHRRRLPAEGPVRQPGRAGHGAAVPRRPAGGAGTARAAVYAFRRPAPGGGRRPAAGDDAHVRHRRRADRAGRREDHPDHRRLPAHRGAAVRDPVPGRGPAAAAAGGHAGGRRRQGHRLTGPVVGKAVPMDIAAPDLPVDPLDVLRKRRSAKWQTYPPDVLPLTVAEMDFALAAPVAEALREAVERSDMGYAMATPGLGRALAGFAASRWNWDLDPASVVAVIDVGVGVVELLRLLARPGDAVVISPPVYPPFFDWVTEAGARRLEVPLAHDDAG